MIILILHIILNAAAIIGLHYATREGMILSFMADSLDRYSHYLTMPLYNCPTCMASIWGTVYFLAYQPAGWHYYPVYILATSATATFLNRLLPSDEPTP